MKKVFTLVSVVVVIVIAHLCGTAAQGHQPPTGSQKRRGTEQVDVVSCRGFQRPNLCQFRSSKEFDARFEAHCKKWHAFLDERAINSKNLLAFDSLIKGCYRDRGEIALGGSGDRDIHYLIDDFVEIVLTVDRHESIVSYVVLPRGLWMRDPIAPGIQVWPVPAPQEPKSSMDAD